MNIYKTFARFFGNRETVVIFAYLAAMVAVPGIGTVAALHLMFMAFTKKGEWYFKSLVYFALLKHFNPIFHPPSTNLFLLFVIILFVIFLIETLMSSKIRLFSLEKKFYLLFLLFALASMAGSLYPAFSLIRIAIVWIFTFVVFQSIRRLGAFDLIQFILRVTALLVFISFPLIFTGAGYMSVGFFKGVINHSQDFALILLPLFMLYLTAVLSHKVPNSLFHMTVLGIGSIELILSASRAAAGAVVITLMLYFILQKSKKVKKKSLISMLFLLAGLILFVTSNPEKVQQRIDSFFMKYKNTGGVTTYEDSIAGRLHLAEVAKENVKAHPLTGIGFNVQTYYQDPLVRLNLERLIKYIPGTSIMYSRPLEKGNLYTSVFEENGIVAGIFFIYLLFSLLWMLYRSGFPYVWTPLFAMMINFNGEASLFSPSGPGNFQMLFIAALYLMALQQKQKAGGMHGA